MTRLKSAWCILSRLFVSDFVFKKKYDRFYGNDAFCIIFFERRALDRWCGLKVSKVRRVLSRKHAYFVFIIQLVKYYCFVFWNCINPFHSESLKWTFPSLNLDMSIVANRNVSQKSKQNSKQCRFWWAVWSGSTLSVHVSSIVYRDKRVNTITNVRNNSN